MNSYLKISNESAVIGFRLRSWFQTTEYHLTRNQATFEIGQNIPQALTVSVSLLYVLNQKICIYLLIITILGQIKSRFNENYEALKSTT